MASSDIQSTSSSDDELDYLKPHSWKHCSSVQIIDIPSGDSQNQEAIAGVKLASNSCRVVLHEKTDISKLQSPSVEQCILDTSSQVHKLPLTFCDEINNGKIEPETTGISSPTSVQKCVVLSDELQGRYTNMQDAECQTVLTGELLAGLDLEKFRDIGSQTISTGDVISLNLCYGDLCNSNYKLPNSVHDPVNDGLYNHMTLKDIENRVNVLQGIITHLFQNVIRLLRFQINRPRVMMPNILCLYLLYLFIMCCILSYNLLYFYCV